MLLSATILSLESSLILSSHALCFGCRSIPGSLAVCGWHLADVQQRLAIQPQNIQSLQVLLQAGWGFWAGDWSCHAEPWLLLWEEGETDCWTYHQMGGIWNVFWWAAMLWKTGRMFWSNMLFSFEGWLLLILILILFKNRLIYLYWPLNFIFFLHFVVLLCSPS